MVGGTINDSPTEVADKTRLLRVKLILEEAVEYAKASGYSVTILDNVTTLNDIGPQLTLAEKAKELADILYVVYGSGVAEGFDLEPIFAEVHRSNMSKGDPIVLVNEYGKVLKGANYSPADITSEILRQQHRNCRGNGTACY
jgi:predicted HAD superfamily Cof-like phosphohydrolase